MCCFCPISICTYVLPTSGDILVRNRIHDFGCYCIAMYMNLHVPLGTHAAYYSYFTCIGRGLNVKAIFRV